MSQEFTTNVDYQQFTHGSVTTNCHQTLDWILSKELKRDQIISISMCETKQEDGQSLIVVFYRTGSSSEDAAPFDQLQFREFTKTKSWEAQAKEAQDFSKTGCQIVSLAHSAKNIMGLQNQVMWFANDSTSTDQSFHYIKETAGDWNAIIKKCFSYLNKYIAPHQLLHVSFFEGSHPNVEVDGEKHIFCCIVHTAGSSPVELRSLANHNLPAQIYNKTVIRGSEAWNSTFDDSKKFMNQFGGENGHIVASANETKADDDEGEGDRIAVVISWQNLVANNLEDSMRPTGCACAIF